MRHRTSFGAHARRRLFALLLVRRRRRSFVAAIRVHYISMTSVWVPVRAILSVQLRVQFSSFYNFSSSSSDIFLRPDDDVSTFFSSRSRCNRLHRAFLRALQSSFLVVSLPTPQRPTRLRHPSTRPARRRRSNTLVSVPVAQTSSRRFFDRCSSKRTSFSRGDPQIVRIFVFKSFLSDGGRERKKEKKRR